MSIEDAVTTGEKYDCYNLSDIFEYMSQDAMDIIYRMMIKSSNKKARVAYWNMLVDRKCSFTTQVKHNKTLSKKLLLKDKAFFYQDFVLEEIL
jgi:S-adenosylmethionine-diacylglycerol 3-amino-3-carboxypropyl transferase